MDVPRYMVQPAREPCFARINTRSALFFVLKSGNICMLPKCLFSKTETILSQQSASEATQIQPLGVTRAQHRFVQLFMSML